MKSVLESKVILSSRMVPKYLNLAYCLHSYTIDKSRAVAKVDNELQIWVFTPFDETGPWPTNPWSDPVEHIMASNKVSWTRVLCDLIDRKLTSKHIMPKSMPDMSESLQARIWSCMQWKVDACTLMRTCIFLTSRCPTTKSSNVAVASSSPFLAWDSNWRGLITLHVMASKLLFTFCSKPIITNKVSATGW